jgi:hypothetical protein
MAPVEQGGVLAAGNFLEPRTSALKELMPVMKPRRVHFALKFIGSPLPIFICERLRRCS